jgi:hypothetical protein
MIGSDQWTPSGVATRESEIRVSQKRLENRGISMKLPRNLFIIATLLMLALLLEGCVLTGQGYWTPDGYSPRGSYYRGSSRYDRPYQSPRFQPYYGPQVGPQIGPQYHFQPYDYRPYSPPREPHQSRSGAHPERRKQPAYRRD